MERGADWSRWLKHAESENFYELVHEFVRSNFAGLFAERHQTLEAVDSRFADISPLDEEAFRGKLQVLRCDERDSVLYRLAGVSVVFAANLVAECWNQYVGGAEDGEYEHRFNRAVLDHYCSLRTGDGRQTTLVDGSPYGVLKCGDWNREMLTLVLSRWDKMEADWLQQLAAELDLDRFCVIVAVTRGLFPSALAVPTARCRVVSLAEICLNEAVRIFESLGTAWLCGQSCEVSSTLDLRTFVVGG